VLFEEQPHSDPPRLVLSVAVVTLYSSAYVPTAAFSPASGYSDSLAVVPRVRYAPFGLASGGSKI